MKRLEAYRKDIILMGIEVEKIIEADNWQSKRTK
jgi:hypothetical protein